MIDERQSLIASTTYTAHGVGEAIGLSDCGSGSTNGGLGVDVNQSQTLDWTIYPVPNGDYWNFINIVRRNLGANFTLTGPDCFVIWSYGSGYWPADFGQWITDRQLASVTATNATSDDGYAVMGTAIPSATTWANNNTYWISQVHAAGISAKTQVYMEGNISSDPNAPVIYSDSKVTDSSGTQLTVACWGSNGQIINLPVFVPTLTNSYGVAMDNVTHWIINTLGADGLYCDGFGSGSFGAWTYADNLWDNCSVILNPTTFAVSRKWSSVALLQQPWQVNLISWLRANGKTFFGNDAVNTKTLMELQVPCFQETIGSYFNLANTHLGSPWGYGNHDVNDDGHNALMIRRMLDRGCVMMPALWQNDPEPGKPNMLALMYPVTLVELHAGCVLGVERIVTHVSGCFGWPDGSAAATYVFNSAGQSIDNLTGYDNASVSTVDNGTGGWLTEVRLQSDHFAIMVKKSPTYTAADLAALLTAFDSTTGDVNWNSAADLDGDGKITSTDLSILLANME